MTYQEIITCQTGDVQRAIGYAGGGNQTAIGYWRENLNRYIGAPTTDDPRHPSIPAQSPYVYIGSDNHTEIFIETKHGIITISELLNKLNELTEKVDALWYATGSIAHTHATASLSRLP